MGIRNGENDFSIPNEKTVKGGRSIEYPKSKLHENWRKASRKYYWKKKAERLRQKEQELMKEGLISGTPNHMPTELLATPSSEAEKKGRLAGEISEKLVHIVLRRLSGKENIIAFTDKISALEFANTMCEMNRLAPGIELTNDHKIRGKPYGLDISVELWCDVDLLDTFSPEEIMVKKE